MTALLLGLDAGTSACRAALYDTRNRLVALSSVPLTVERPAPGWVEQDVESIWAAARATIRGVLAASGARPGDIAGVAACGHSPTLILLDSRLRPIRPAIVWQDTRASGEAREIAQAVGDDWKRILGAPLPVSQSFHPPRLLWLSRHEPEVLARARKVVEPKDYINTRLVGRAVSDAWSGKGLINLATRRSVVAEWCDVVPLPVDLAPDVTEPQGLAGVVSDEAARETGLLAGTPVGGGWTDGQCCMIGTGAFVGRGLGWLVSGTSEVAGAVCSGPPVGDPRLTEVPGPYGRRVVMGPTQCSGASLVWFAGQFVGGDVERALALAAESEPGARGLVFLPYLEGERAPIWDPAARGLFFGISLRHELADFARAVLEGVAAGGRHILEAVEEVGAVRIERVRLAGGAGRGEVWNQIKADMLGRPIELTSQQPGTLGAAMLAGVAAGVWRDLDEASAAIEVTATVEPRPETRAIYDRQFALFRDLYPALRPLFERAAQG